MVFLDLEDNSRYLEDQHLTIRPIERTYDGVASFIVTRTAVLELLPT